MGSGAFDKWGRTIVWEVKSSIESCIILDGKTLIQIGNWVHNAMRYDRAV